MSIEKLIVSSCIILSMCAVRADTYTWVGGTGTWDANSGAKWRALSTGETGTVPGAGDNAVLPAPTDANYTVTASEAISVKSLTIGTAGSTSGFVATFNSNTLGTHLVAEDLVVETGGVMTHAEIPNSRTALGSENARLIFSVGGDMVVNGSIDVSGKGFRPQKGPGTHGGYEYSASHGGSGGDLNGSRCYGSLTQPIYAGSGAGNGGSAGGGAVRLDVTGALTLNGTVNASTQRQAATGSGSGGSVWITCATLMGSESGVIDVSGGQCKHGRSGGGGRLAVHQTTATDFSAWHGKLLAHGGLIEKDAPDANLLVGGSGTIYLQAAGQTEATATVILDQTGGLPLDARGVYRSSAVHAVTPLTAAEGASVIGNLVIANHAKATFGAAGQTTSIYGDIDTTDGDIAESQGAVVLAGEGTQTICGDASWTVLSCTEPGKTLRFGTGENDVFSFSASANVTLAGEGGSPLVLTPAVAGEAWRMCIPPGAAAGISFVSVDHSDASSGSMIYPEGSIDGGDNVNWTFGGKKIGAVVAWTGAADDDWNNAANWVDEDEVSRLPSADDTVVISPDCENYPVLGVSQSFHGLVVQTGATLTVSADLVSVTNALAVWGTLVFTGGSTLEVSAPTASFAGATVVPGASTLRILDGVESFDPGGCTFYLVEIPRSGGTLVVADGLKAKFLKAHATDAATLVFAAGSVVEAESLICNCDAESDEAYLTLASSEPGAPWFVKTPRTSYMMRVSVSDSTASDAQAVASRSVNGGRNVNWSFGNYVSEWVGGTGAFDTAANWYPAVVPGVTNDVILFGAGAITANGNVNVRSLTIMPDKAVASLTVKGVLTTVGDAVVGTNATLTLSTTNEFNEIGGNFVVCAGGKVTHPELAALATTLADGENGAKVIVRAQNIVVEAGGRVDVSAKGYAPQMGPAAGKAWMGIRFFDPDGNGHLLGAGHAGSYDSTLAGTSTTNARPTLTGYRAYGSMFEPMTYGSGGHEVRGGGVIRLVAAGDIQIDGIVCADGSGSSYSSAGGSVWLTAGGALKGAGNISAAGGACTADYPGSGGRIAIYASANDFTGDVRASRPEAGKNYMSQPSGTVLVKLAGEKNHSLLLDLAGYDTMDPTARAGFETDAKLVQNATDIPTAEDLDKLDLIKNMSVTCGHISVFNLTHDLKLCDFNFTEAKGSKARLNLHTLKLLSSAHKKGAGWAVENAGDDRIAAHIWPCANDAGEKGSVVWPSGLALIIR